MPWAWLFAGLAASALFAGGVSLFSADALHRLWGLSAACAYAVGALAVLAWRSRDTRGVDVALGVIFCGAILFPLLWMVAHGHGEPEVGVVDTAAKRQRAHVGSCDVEPIGVSVNRRVTISRAEETYD